MPLVRRTSISLPEALYQSLRRAAVRNNTSLAEFIRSRLRESLERSRFRDSKDPILRVAGVARGPVLSAGIDEFSYGR